MVTTAISILPRTHRVLDVTDPRPEPARARVWIGVVCIAAAIAHACGYLFGVSNQVTYFVEPLHRVHPELWRHDWLTTHTTTYHALFAMVASWLFRLDDTGAIACAIAHAALMIGVVIALFIIARGVARSGTFAVFAIVAAWLLINGDRSMAGSYLWSGYLQPSLIATLGWMFALAAYVRGRPLVTGIALAVGGLFHANFLVLGIGMFALAEVFATRDKLSTRLAFLLTPQLLALAAITPALKASASGADPELALWVLAKFHAPGHYSPFAIAHTVPVLVRWVGFALVVAPIAIEHGRSIAVRRLVTWCWLAGAICVLAVPVLMVPRLLVLTRFYVWRIAPFAQLTAMLVIAIAMVATIEAPARWRSQPWWRVVAAIGFGVWVVWRAPTDPAAFGGGAPIVVVAGIAIAVVAARARAMIPVMVAIAGLAIALGARWQVIRHPHVAIASVGVPTDDLYAWARSSTSADAVFLTPPDLPTFRLEARRAIIVDLKSPPLVPDELVEWYRRLCKVTGEPALRSVRQAIRRWRESTRAELLVRAKGLGANYLVLERFHTDAELATSVYANESYIVFATEP